MVPTATASRAPGRVRTMGAYPSGFSRLSATWTRFYLAWLGPRPNTEALPSTWTDSARRRLMVGIVIATLMTWATVIAALARGGRPAPPTLRAAATLLDGAWQLRVGDDPRWADPNADASGW